MTKINSNNFNFTKYKEEVSVYKNYTDKIDDLKKQKESLKPSSFFAYGISIFLIFILIISFFENTESNFFGIFFVSLYIAYLFKEFFYTDFFINIKSLGKLNQLKKKVIRIQELHSNSYSDLQPFEKSIRNYFETQLKEFFEKNLYKKRSGNQKFEESLSEFSLMIDEILTLNLITTTLLMSEYKDYLIRRTIDHNFQLFKNTEKLDSIRSLVKNFSKEPIQKEILSPEKLYRIARKINNWEEINKKKKITGLKGEEITILVEQEYFKSIGRDDLAQKVRHVSVEDGDGLGYDVLSYFKNGREKYIEVKSTVTSLSAPFYLSRNEFEFLKEHYHDAFIYRILVSEDMPQIISYSSVEILEEHELIPVQYIVKSK